MNRSKEILDAVAKINAHAVSNPDYETRRIIWDEDFACWKYNLVPCGVAYEYKFKASWNFIDGYKILALAKQIEEQNNETHTH